MYFECSNCRNRDEKKQEEGEKISIVTLQNFTM